MGLVEEAQLESDLGQRPISLDQRPACPLDAPPAHVLAEGAALVMSERPRQVLRGYTRQPGQLGELEAGPSLVVEPLEHATEEGGTALGDRI